MKALFGDNLKILIGELTLCLVPIGPKLSPTPKKGGYPPPISLVEFSINSIFKASSFLLLLFILSPFPFSYKLLLLLF